MIGRENKIIEENEVFLIICSFILITISGDFTVKTVLSFFLPYRKIFRTYIKNKIKTTYVERILKWHPISTNYQQSKN